MQNSSFLERLNEIIERQVMTIEDYKYIVKHVKLFEANKDAILQETENNNDSISLHLRSFCYDNETDYDKREGLLLQSVDMGNSYAMITLGINYRTFAEVNSDENKTLMIEKSYNCFSEAIKFGNPLGYYNMALMYYNDEIYITDEEIYIGEDEELDRDVLNRTSYLEFIEKAANSGIIDAQIHVGNYYREKTEFNSDQYIPECLHWYKMASENGSKYASFIVAQIYMNDIYRTQDREKAIEYYKIAAEQYHIGAMKQLGMIYLNGIHIDMDVDEAIKWYITAYHHEISKITRYSDVNPATQLGFIFLSDEYGMRNESLGIMWLLRADDDPVAQNKLNLFLDNKVNAKDVLKHFIHYADEQKDKLKEANKIIQKQKAIIADLRFKPGGPGYDDTRAHFNGLQSAIEKDFTDGQIKDIIYGVVNNIVNIIDNNSEEKI